MLSIEELDKGLLGRILTSEQNLVKEKLDLREFFFPKLGTTLDGVANR